MTRRIAHSLRRALTAAPAREAVHFHLGHDGRAFVCDLARCESAALSLSDVERRAA